MVGTHVLALVSAKRSRNAKVDLPFDDYYASMLLNLSQTPIGMETYHSRASPVTFGPNPYLESSTHYLPYTSSYVLGSYSIRFSSSRRPEKSTILRV